MTRKTILFICYLILLFCAAKIAYNKFYRPRTAAGQQHEEAVKRARLEHEEAVKRAQLEADLKKAVEAGHKSNRTSQRSTRRSTTTRRT